MSDGKEACARCGDMGLDRRTLWMACFYAMHELGVPFEESAILGVHLKKIGTAGAYDVNQYEEPRNKEMLCNEFYKLRVCKDCRGSWMREIKDWFNRGRG